MKKRSKASPLTQGLALTEEQRELQQLCKENKRLRMERDILEKSLFGILVGALFLVFLGAKLCC